jgi:ATP-dependent DNA ligase
MTTTLPNIVPLVLKPQAEAFDNAAWLFDATGARLLSRNRNRFPHLDPLAAALAKRLRVTDAILDGEVICPDETGRPVFLDLLRRRKPVSFIAFDLLWLNGEDLRELPLLDRKARLQRLLARRSNPFVTEAMSVEGSGRALMAVVREHDLEGIVAKRKGDPYQRGVRWWKIKNRAYSQAVGRSELFNGARGHRHRRHLDRAAHSAS